MVLPDVVLQTHLSSFRTMFMHHHPCRGRPLCLPWFWATTGGCSYNLGNAVSMGAWEILPCSSAPPLPCSNEGGGYLVGNAVTKVGVYH